MASLSYSDVRGLAQTILDDTNTATGITAAQWLTLINAAHRHVWTMLVDIAPSWFQTTTTITWPAATEQLDISGGSYLNANPYKVCTVEVTPTTAALGPGNLPRVVAEMRYEDRASRLSQDPMWLYTASGQAAPQWYTMTTNYTMTVAPIPSSATVMRITYIPTLTALAGNETGMFGGRAPEFHDCVAYRAALLANMKREGSNPLAGAMWQEASERIQNAAASRVVSGPRSIRWVR